MTRLSEFQVNEFCDMLVALSRKVGKGKGDEKLYAVEVLVQRFRRAYERDKAGSAIPDGFPRGSGGGAGSSGLPRRTVDEDEHGPQESVEFTSVELAHIDREERSKSNRDHHHELTVNATGALERAVRALDELNSFLSRAENLIDTNPDAASAEQGCRSHARVKDGSGRAYFEGLDREKGARDGLCRWCYDWRADHDELPSVALVERKIRKNTITTKDVEETRRTA